MKILLIATRELDGRQTGRKRVLATIVRSCAALGHSVDVAVIGARPALGVGNLDIASPSWAATFANVLLYFVFGSKSLNECLYWSSAGQRQIDALVAEQGYDVVVADMVRAAQFCLRLPVPWVLDLDDLLSDRYARLAGADDARMLLGHFAQRLPVRCRPAANRVARGLLRIESRRIASRERRFGAAAGAVTLVSPVEAQKLARQLGRRVHDTAMAIDTVPASVAPRAALHPQAVVFVGGLDYEPNLEAVRHYVNHIAPALSERGCDVALHVVGNAPLALRPHDPTARTVYLGYVDDLAEVLGAYAIFVAPILASGGLKTKVLEAMASGLAVVATEQAVAGLGVEAGVECWVTDAPAAFAAAIIALLSDAENCARVGRAGQGFVTAHFAPAVLREKWRTLLAAAAAH